MDASERKEPTSKAAWKKTVAAQPLEVPSGNTALVRRISLEIFIKQGRIPNALMPMVREAIQGKTDFMSDIEKWDNEQLSALMNLVDSVVIIATEAPVVTDVPVCPKCHGSRIVNAETCGSCLGKGELNRDPDLLYVDEVDFPDKMKIYSYAIGGPVEAAGTFRDEPPGDVEPLRDGEDVAVLA